MAKVRKGWEDCKHYGPGANGRKILGEKLGDLSVADLQFILDSDPKNAVRMIDGIPSKNKAQDNAPGEPKPAKP